MLHWLEDLLRFVLHKLLRKHQSQEFFSPPIVLQLSKHSHCMIACLCSCHREWQAGRLVNKASMLQESKFHDDQEKHLLCPLGSVQVSVHCPHWTISLSFEQRPSIELRKITDWLLKFLSFFLSDLPISCRFHRMISDKHHVPFEKHVLFYENLIHFSLKMLLLHQLIFIDTDY